MYIGGVMGELVGYARVSSTGQDLTIQLDKLQGYGCRRIFEEKKSGTSANRAELQECLRYLRDDDTLVVSKLDRLARSTLHLTQIAHDLEQRNINLVVIDQAIDTTTPTGKLLFNMLASIAEFETAIRAERQAEGIAKAQANGVQFGAKPKVSDEQVQALRQKRSEGVLIRELMVEYELSKASVYRLLSRNNNTDI